MLKTIIRLLSYIRFYKQRFLVGASLLVIATGLELYSPMIAKRLIDQVLTPAYETGVLNKEWLIILLMSYLLLNSVG